MKNSQGILRIILVFTLLPLGRLGKIKPIPIIPIPIELDQFPHKLSTDQFPNSWRLRVSWLREAKQEAGVDGMDGMDVRDLGVFAEMRLSMPVP